MLQGKHIFVTGGSRGIGNAIVRAAVDADAKVTFSYRSDKEAADDLVSQLNAGRETCVRAVCCDTTNLDAVRGSFSEAAGAFGPIDVLVNNAGITRDFNLISMGENDWKEVIDTNLTGTYNATKAVIFDFLKRKQGTIINITSIAGIDGNAGQSNYSASKAGVIGFTASLAKEVGPYGIRVNAVAPGFIETDMSSKVIEQKRAEIVNKIPLRRIGLPNQVARVTIFLASDAADYITGQVLRVDGGMTV